MSSGKHGTSRGIADANFNSLTAQHTLAAVAEREELLWLAKADVYTNQALEAMMIEATTEAARDNRCVYSHHGEVDGVTELNPAASGMCAASGCAQTRPHRVEDAVVANRFGITRSTQSPLTNVMAHDAMAHQLADLDNPQHHRQSRV